MGKPDEYVEIKDTGTVTTYTFTGAWKYEGGTTVDDGAPAEPPLVIAGIMLDGSDTMTVVTLDDAKPEEVYVGMRVKLVLAGKPARRPRRRLPRHFAEGIVPYRPEGRSRGAGLLLKKFGVRPLLSFLHRRQPYNRVS